MTKKQILKECEKAHKSWLKEITFQQKEDELAYQRILKFIEKEKWADAENALSDADHLGLEYHFSDALSNELYEKGQEDENQ